MRNLLLFMLLVGIFMFSRNGLNNGFFNLFSFNGVKDHFSARRSKVMTVLTWITMRDFYALAGAVLVGLGMAAIPALITAAARARSSADDYARAFSIASSQSIASAISTTPRPARQ